jgi:diacylglycerol kinase family enzyme
VPVIVTRAPAVEGSGVDAIVSRGGQGTIAAPAGPLQQTGSTAEVVTIGGPQHGIMPTGSSGHTIAPVARSAADEAAIST